MACPSSGRDDYLKRLIGLGHRVAMCEQIEDPGGSAQARLQVAGEARRRAARDPGTITEERLLEPGRANILLAIARVRSSDEAWTYGLAAADISTGAFTLSETSAEGITGEIARIEPSGNRRDRRHPR